MAMGLAGKGALAIFLLCCSNAAMTTAWYLHLKFHHWPMYQAIFISWGIAFAEYCLQVPANRIGYAGEGGPFTAPQLKIIQEFIALVAFAIFSTYVLKEKLRWADFGAFVLIFAGVLVSLLTKAPSAATSSDNLDAAPANRTLLQKAAWHLSQPAVLPLPSYPCLKHVPFGRSKQALPPEVQLAPDDVRTSCGSELSSTQKAPVQMELASMDYEQQVAESGEGAEPAALGQQQAVEAKVDGGTRAASDAGGTGDKQTAAAAGSEGGSTGSSTMPQSSVAGSPAAAMDAGAGADADAEGSSMSAPDSAQLTADKGAVTDKQ